MRFPIGLKIFGIAVGLLVLMAAAALLSMRMTRTVDAQLAIIDQNYFPAYVALAQANIRSVEQSAFVRRLLAGDRRARRQRRRSSRNCGSEVASTGKASDEDDRRARQHDQPADRHPLDFDDNIALARLDDRIGACRRNGGATKRCSPSCLPRHRRPRTGSRRAARRTRRSARRFRPQDRCRAQRNAPARRRRDRRHPRLSAACRRDRRGIAGDRRVRSASWSPPPSRSAWSARCAGCCSAPPPSKAAPSTPSSRSPRATKSAG